MAEIEFIQFLPNNARKRVLIERPAKVAGKAKAITSRGFRLECKNLGDGDVMLAVADGEMDFLLASRTVKNGPLVLEAIDGLLADVNEVLEARDRRRRAAALGI